MWDRDSAAASLTQLAAAIPAAPLRDARGGGADAAGAALRHAEARLVAAGIPLPQVFDLTEALYEKLAHVGDWYLDLVEPLTGRSVTDGQTTETHLRRQVLQVVEALLDLSLAEASRRLAGRTRHRPPGPDPAATPAAAPARSQPAAGTSGQPDRRRTGPVGARGGGLGRIPGRP